MEKIKVQIKLLSQEIRVSCYEHERELLDKSVAYITEEANKLTALYKNIPAQQLLAIVSLNVAKELLDSQKSSEEIENILKAEDTLASSIAENISKVKSDIEAY